jgi:hypothetical protein
VIADAVQFLHVDQLAELAQPAAPPSEDRAVIAAEVTRLESELQRQRKEGPQRPRVMTVMEESTIEDASICIRGSVHQVGEKAPRGFLQVASYGTPPTFSSGESGRRELADWLASNRNPLTARVLVNRVWHYLLGAGLVPTTDNFGTTGEPPSHPELLDYLAVEFMENGWSIKKLVRTIVLSRTYRLSSTPTEQMLTCDPENRWLARAHQRRIEAEYLRDAMLVISGRLRLEMGGSSIGPGIEADYGYQHTSQRRTIYVPMFRNVLPEILTNFDFADPSVVTGNRSASTISPQALFMMNHAFVREQAEHAARQVLADDANDDQRLQAVFEMILGRLPYDQERVACRQFLATFDTARGTGDRQEAWTELVHALFASLDFRYLQ